MGGQDGQLPTQILVDQLTQLTLSQQEGDGCAPTLQLDHPALGSFLRH